MKLINLIMTLSDDEKIVIEYQGNNLFCDKLVDIRDELELEHLMMEVVSVRYSIIYRAIIIEVE